MGAGWDTTYAHLSIYIYMERRGSDGDENVSVSYSVLLPRNSDRDRQTMCVSEAALFTLAINHGFNHKIYIYYLLY